MTTPLCHDRPVDLLGGRPVGTGYHGADGDTRYPSPRRLRNAIAHTIDIVVMVALLVGIAGYLVLRTRLLTDHPWSIAVVALVMFTANLTNLVLLPSRAGGSIGQLLTGLARIRGADGTRPTISENGRAYFRGREVFRVGGVHAEAPEFVVVRRQDTVAANPARAVDGSGHTVGSYREH